MVVSNRERYRAYGIDRFMGGNLRGKAQSLDIKVNPHRRSIIKLEAKVAELERRIDELESKIGRS